MTDLTTEHIAVEETDRFKAPNTRRMLAYWRERAGERERPTLQDIDLMAIYDIAPSLCIRDVVDGGQDLKCRFWGTEFVQAYKVDCTGKLVSQTYDGFGMNNTLALHERALATDGPLRVVGNLGYAGKDDFISLEGIMLVLDGKSGPKSHILAVAQFDYKLDAEDRKLFERPAPNAFTSGA